MITNISNKDGYNGKVAVRATSLNPRWREGTIREIHASIALIWIRKGWVEEIGVERNIPAPPDPIIVERAKEKVITKKKRTTKKK